ncbi:ROK family transcriptional regulator [Vallitalea sp.]|jgi:predicted NBD/HSP70 family sugar kinase|uniref:ROK family transcriptional regulator n=1 Tax=Vallitalea sp. TaxID=1882829 RepID=UPI0025E863CF|nr:ROK family transcriptional regulator [Vallitalea sp.]MCT4688863.1 ROK family transcriptional regulator [Vallitalea sp.]
MIKVTSPDLMKINNKKQILEMIYSEKNIYRAQIAEMTNMSNQTITNLVKELLNEGIVKEVTIENKSKGRNPMALSINNENICSIGVEVSVEMISVGLFDVDGNMLNLKNYTRSNITSNVLDIVKKLLEQVISNCVSKRILGIGISIEGIVDSLSGLVIKSKSLGLDGINILKELEYLGIPVLIKNDVNMLAETDYGKELLNNYMLIKLDSGIGAALVLDGYLLKSSHTAGEFGHVKIHSINKPKLCKCGQYGCLTTEASISAIESKTGLSFDDFIKQYKLGDSKIQSIINDVSRYICEPLINIITLLDLERVILTGKLVNALGDEFIDSIKQYIDDSLNSFSSYKGLKILNNVNVIKRCSSYVFYDYFLNWKEHL